VNDRHRDSVGGERREAADAPRPNESLRQAARLRFPGLVRCHYASAPVRGPLSIQLRLLSMLARAVSLTDGILTLP